MPEVNKRKKKRVLDFGVFLKESRVNRNEIAFDG